MNTISPLIPDSQVSTSTLSEVLMIKPTLEVPMKIANTTPTESIKTESVKSEIPVCNDNSYLVWKGPSYSRQPYCWEK